MDCCLSSSITVEVCMKSNSTAKKEHVEMAVRKYLYINCFLVKNGKIFSSTNQKSSLVHTQEQNSKEDTQMDEEEENYNNKNEKISTIQKKNQEEIKGIKAFLEKHVDDISICDLPENMFNSSKIIHFNEISDSKLNIYIFTMNEEGAMEETLDEFSEGNENAGENGQDVTACTHFTLPNRNFHGIWETLYYDDDQMKHNLLEYSSTLLLFADANVNPNVINWNKVILLHGPPGSGKTSLCKALAQKLTIRMSNRYSFGQLVEINAHSLFSKWFSESGKLVQKLFTKIKEMVEDPEVFLCVLIDEVESLSAARKAAMSGTEPSDAIRVVNALLTQIDSLKQYPNVLILTTSNITQAIDLAFVDRADIKQYVGLPSARARYAILLSCVAELMRAKIIKDSASESELLQYHELENHPEKDIHGYSTKLKSLSELCSGLSGRSLRKLPFISHAFFIRLSSCSLSDFLIALEKGIQKELDERTKL